MEKPVNRLIKERLKLKIKFLLILLLSISFSINLFSQQENKSSKSIIGEITVSGNTSFSPITIITYSGHREGDEISIPGEKNSTAINAVIHSLNFNVKVVNKFSETSIKLPL